MTTWVVDTCIKYTVCIIHVRALNAHPNNKFAELPACSVFMAPDTVSYCIDCVCHAYRCAHLSRRRPNCATCKPMSMVTGRLCSANLSVEGCGVSVPVGTFFFLQWRKRPPVGQGLLIVEASHDHTQTHTTLGRTPLDEWSARRRDLYLTTHDTHNRQTSMLSAGFEPAITASERPKTHALDARPLGSAPGVRIFRKRWRSHLQILRARIVTWPVNLTVIWRFLLDSCDPIHVFVCKWMNCSNYAENIRRYRTQYSRLGGQTRVICHTWFTSIHSAVICDACLCAETPEPKILARNYGC
jgi:hypothetical protein